MTIPIPASVQCQSYDAFSSALSPHMAGPSLEKGPLPAVLYLALSAEESLTLDPINQLVAHLPLDSMRAFSVTLPAHGDDIPRAEAISHLAKELHAGRDPFAEFLEQTGAFCHHLIEQEIVRPDAFAVAGLSRGGHAAFSLLARFSSLTHLCALAPVTDWSLLPEFRGADLLDQYNLTSQTSNMLGKPLYFAIGNRDTRVITKSCVELVSTLVEENYAKGYRSPPVELHLHPSIGHKGHGTPPYVFFRAAKWLARELLSESLIKG